MGCSLYRHFDADGQLLYVGIALSPTYRLAKHRANSMWFERIANITVQWYATREAALEAERLAIRTEGPLENVAHSMRRAAEMPNLMPWGPRGRPFYEGEPPCPPEVQQIFIRKGWW